MPQDRRLSRVVLCAVAAVMLAVVLCAPIVRAPTARAQASLAPTNAVDGWGAKEGWILCPSGQSTCNERPVAVPGLANIVALDAANSFNLALDSSGTVWAWGQNTNGQLGNGTTTASATPEAVPGLPPIVAPATGNNFALALDSSGTVWAWGYNNAGQLGDGTTQESLSPQQISGLTEVTAVAAGGDHSLALLSSGAMRAWGKNNDGQLGDGTTTGRKRPVAVQGTTDGVSSTVVAISSGNLFSDAQLADGALLAWGNNAYGQLGDGTTTNSALPVVVQGLTDGVSSTVVAFSAGGSEPTNGHQLALLSDGTALAWGDNAAGQLGNGTTINRSVPVIVQGTTDGTSSQVVAVAAGGAHSMALLADGAVLTWGANGCGQLGNGTTSNSSVPLVALTGAQGIAAGAADSFAALPAS